MDMFVIRGGTPLCGTVRVGGAKNAALPIMAAALLADGPTVLHDVPDLVDVTTLSRLLETLGVEVRRTESAPPARSGAESPLRLPRPAGLQLLVGDERPYVAEYDLVRRMRASFCVLGPLLARRGRACVSLPGGCAIGDRPIDLHLKGLRALGADIRVERGYVIATARRLRGSDIFLGGPCGSTVTGTCNVMCAATLAEGVTTIESAACEPEVVDLGAYLNRMGARIAGLGTPFLRIEGVDRLGGTEHTVIPDRIEAATLMLAAAITGGCVRLENVSFAHLTAVVEKLREIGVEVGLAARGPGEAKPADRHAPTHGDAVTVAAPARLAPSDIVALPYPGIPTDVQAQFMALLAVADGMSVVTDKVFPDRFLHAAELLRLGARIRREGPTAVIGGVRRLSGACVMASDLRASAALVLAGLAAEGATVVRRIYHLDRGYERLETKLNHLGADIRRVEDEPANMPASWLSAVAHSPPLTADLPHALRPPQFLGRAPVSAESEARG